MTRKSNIQYQQVADVCNDLVKGGDSPSVRKIHQRLGGSFSTISEFFNKWQSQQTLAKLVDTDLSKEFRQAVLAEFGRVTRDLKERLQAQVNEKAKQLDESRELLTEYEQQIESLKTTLAETQAEAQHRQLQLEKQLSSAETKVASSVQHEAALQQQLDDWRERYHHEKLKAAVAEAHNRDYEKRLQEWKSAPDNSTTQK